MNHEQFIAKLVEMGYKVLHREDYGIMLRNRRKSVTVQKWHDYDNVFYENYSGRNNSYEYNQHRITNYAQALRNITKFERKLGI